MNEEMFELMAEQVHNGWMKEKLKQGFHNPKKCPHKGFISELNTLLPCPKCHKDIIPYKDLTEPVKELDRVMIREFEKNLNKLGGYVTFPNSLRYISRRASDDLQTFKKCIVDNLKNGIDLVSMFWCWHEEHRVNGLELYCPKCGWDKKGYTVFKGRLVHACDPGCCCTMVCPKCGSVYGVSENKDQHWDVKKKRMVTRNIEKYFKKKPKR